MSSRLISSTKGKTVLFRCVFTSGYLRLNSFNRVHGLKTGICSHFSSF